MSSAAPILFRRGSSSRASMMTVSTRGMGVARLPSSLITSVSLWKAASFPQPACSIVGYYCFSSHQSPEPSPTRSSSASSSKTSSTTMIKAYMDLSKARLSTLVVATTAAGFVAAGGPLSPVTLGACCAGTALCSASAAALNQIFEIDRDSKMKRTQQRPLVQGTISTTEATVAATAWGVTGISVLAYATDPVTTALGASNMVLYAGLYTYLKPRSVYNTWVGAVVGAIPPVMGWTAATGGQLWDVEALLLGSTLYLWQMPHFFALSYMHRIDYARGGFHMVPVLESSDGDQTSRLITRYAWYLSSIPLWSTLMDVTSSMFFLEGLVLNGYALHVAYKFRNDRTNANARKVFLTSLWYLPSLLMLFLLHSKTWDEEAVEQQEEYGLRMWISSNIHAIRDKGRTLCLHESIIQKNDSHQTDKACPVVLGKAATLEVAQTAVNVKSIRETQA